MKNGGLQRQNPDGRWMFAAEPNKPRSRAAINAANYRARRARGDVADPYYPAAAHAAKRAMSRRPSFTESLSEDEKVRLKLRDRMRAQMGSKAPMHLPSLPGVDALAIATRYIDGGRDTFIEYVQMAVLENHPAATAWYFVYADLTAHERKYVKFGDLCIAAGVKPSTLMAEVVSTVMDRGADAGNLIAAAMHPEVIATLAKSGKLIDGNNPEIYLRDRHAFLQGRGFLPVPKGNTLSVHLSANAAAAAAAQNEPTVPSFSANMRRLSGGRTAAAAAALPDADPALDLVQPAPARVPVGEDD